MDANFYQREKFFLSIVNALGLRTENGNVYFKMDLALGSH